MILQRLEINNSFFEKSISCSVVSFKEAFTYLAFEANYATKWNFPGRILAYSDKKPGALSVLIDQ